MMEEEMGMDEMSWNEECESPCTDCGGTNGYHTATMGEGEMGTDERTYNPDNMMYLDEDGTELVSSRKVIRSGRGDERMARMFAIDMPEVVNVEMDEERNYTGTSVCPTEFRLPGGETADWDVILTSTRDYGKHAGDMDVPENPTPRQYALKAIFDVKSETGRRKYQVGGWVADSDTQLTREWQGNLVPAIEIGTYHYYWLKIPQPGRQGRVEYATAWAQNHCKPGGVKNMIKALLNFWDQRIEYVRVQVMPTAYTPEGSEQVIPAHMATAFHRYVTYDNWSECKLNQQLVQAANRARRASSSEQYVDDQARIGEYDLEEQEEVVW